MLAKTEVKFVTFLIHIKVFCYVIFIKVYVFIPQAVIKKLGKKEDEHVVASDHELDAKLEVRTNSNHSVFQTTTSHSSSNQVLSIA